MPSKHAIRLSWVGDSPALLAGWRKRAKTLGLPAEVAEENAAAIRAALTHAAACRCAEHEATIVKLTSERDRAKATRDDAVSLAVVAAEKAAPTNPLRSLRTAAGLSQSEAAERLGITRGALSQSEQRATVSAAMVERARKAYGVGS